MSKALIIATREYLSLVRSKAFVFSLALAPLFAALSIVLSPPDAEEALSMGEQRILLVSDDKDLIARTKNRIPNIEIEVMKTTDFDATQRDRINTVLIAKELALAIEIGPVKLPEKDDSARDRDPIEDNANLSVDGPGTILNGADIVIRSINPTGALERALRGVVSDEVQLARMLAAGIGPQQITWLTSDIDVEIVDPSASDSAFDRKRMIVPVATTLLVFMAVMGGAFQLLNVLVEEKQQRIAEVLLGSVSPSQLMFGKLIGALGVGLTSTTVYLGVAITYAYSMDFGHFVTASGIAWIFFNVTLAVIMFGAIMIAFGAAANDTKDAQAFIMPIMILVMTPIFFMSRVFENPNGGLSTALSLFPLTAPMLMPIRLGISNDMPMWQVGVGVFGELACAALLVWTAGRIFRVGILGQGKRPSLRELLQWIARG